MLIVVVLMPIILMSAESIFYYLGELWEKYLLPYWEVYVTHNYCQTYRWGGPNFIALKNRPDSEIYQCLGYNHSYQYCRNVLTGREIITSVFNSTYPKTEEGKALEALCEKDPEKYCPKWWWKLHKAHNPYKYK